MRFSIVCVEIQSSENLGALARLCSNFEADSLIAVRPQCTIRHKKTYYTAADARDYIDGIVRLDDLQEVYERVDYLLALTGRPAKDSLERNVVTIFEAAEMVPDVHVGIVLGPENAGLSNRDLMTCDLAATIPLKPELRTHRILNISHAAALALFELQRKDLLGIELDTGHEPVSSHDRELLRTYISEIAAGAHVPDRTKESAAQVVDSVFSRALVNKRELGVLLTLLRGINTRISGEK